MSDKVNNYASQNLDYQAQLAALTEDYKAGKIDAKTYVQQTVLLELRNFKTQTDIDKNRTQLEKPSDKALGELKDLGLEALLSFISGENRKASMKSAESRIASNKAEREANFQNTMDKINENIKKAEEKENASWWQKALGWVANVITAIVAVATLVVGVLSLNPAVIALGVAACYFAASSITAQATGQGLTERMLGPALTKVFGETAAKLICTGIDLVGGFICTAYSGAGLASMVKAGADASKTLKAAASIATYIDKTKYIATGMNGATTLGSGTAAGFATYYQYKADQGKIDQMALKKALEKLMVEDQEVQKTVKQILEYFQHMTDDVTQVVKDKNNTMTNVMSVSPSGNFA